MTTKESNILIAEHIGWKIDNSFPDKGRVWRGPGGELELDTTLKFHYSWEALMPVIKSLGLKECSTDIKIVYEDVINFLITI